MQRLSNPARIGLAALATVVILLPLVVTNHFAIDICIRILLFAFIGVAWNLMGGYAKQLSLGHAAYLDWAPIRRRLCKSNSASRLGSACSPAG